MSRKENGIQAIVKASCSPAVYVHCSVHVLNLVLVKSYAIPEIHNTFDFTLDITSFLNQAANEMHD